MTSSDKQTTRKWCLHSSPINCIPYNVVKHSIFIISTKNVYLHKLTNHKWSVDGGSAHLLNISHEWCLPWMHLDSKKVSAIALRCPDVQRVCLYLNCLWDAHLLDISLEWCLQWMHFDLKKFRPQLSSHCMYGEFAFNQTVYLSISIQLLLWRHGVIGIFV